MIRASIIGLSLFAGIAEAAECRLTLMQALDASGGVDAAEDMLQRGGLVAALTPSELRAAFFATDEPVALTVFESSGRYNHKVLLDRTLIDGPDAQWFAAKTVATSMRSPNGFATAIGYALGYGAYPMVGDGQNNHGSGSLATDAEFFFADVTVSGPVVNGANYEAETGLIAFYKRRALHGPGAFVASAQGFKDYERARRRKLERERTPFVIGLRDNAPPIGSKG